jgi:hypothetical protein
MCVVHGGKAPQVKLKAEQRLVAMVDPVLTEMFRIALKGESDGVRLAAGRDLLDRAGLKPTLQVEASQAIDIHVVRHEQPIGYLQPTTRANGHTAAPA